MQKIHINRLKIKVSVCACVCGLHTKKNPLENYEKALDKTARKAAFPSPLPPPSAQSIFQLCSHSTSLALTLFLLLALPLPL